MLPVLRSALLICVALGATVVAPAQADPSNTPLTPVTVASLPEVPVPDLLDPEGETHLSGPGTQSVTIPAVTTPEEPDAAPARWSGDLASLVADYRGTEAGSR